MMNDYGFDVEYHRAQKGIEKARNEIYGDHESSFDKLRCYLNEAEKVNPGSHFCLEVNAESHRFERCFIAFRACLDGFKFLRPLIFLDGTFLKGRYRGVLLGATSKDGDEGIVYCDFSFNLVGCMQLYETGEILVHCCVVCKFSIVLFEYCNVLLFQMTTYFLYHYTFEFDMFTSCTFFKLKIVEFKEFVKKLLN